MEKVLMKSLGLLLEQGGGAFVPDHEIGFGHLSHNGMLGGQNSLNHILAESVPEG
jgi:hypothetical protein